MNRSERLALVDHDDPGLPVVTQCQLLKIARSTLYYRPAPMSADDLAVMRRMDELHLALKNPPPLVPNCFIAICEAVGPTAIVCSVTLLPSAIVTGSTRASGS